MKLSILKSSLLLLAIFATAIFTSCEKDEDDRTAEDLKKEIAGVWDVTSFKVGGSEYINTVVEAASIEYKTFTGTQGDFIQTIKYFDEDTTETNRGKYAVLDGSSVKMTDDGESYTLKVTLNGDNLQLEGQQDGKPLEIKAKRRDPNGAGAVKTKLVGIWDFSSLKIGGQEHINTSVEKGSLRFDAYTGAEGNFQQKLKFKDETLEEVTEGKYKVLDNNRVEMTAKGETHIFRVAFNGNNVQLEGAQDGLSLVIKAGKRN